MKDYNLTLFNAVRRSLERAAVGPVAYRLTIELNNLPSAELLPDAQVGEDLSSRPDFVLTDRRVIAAPTCLVS
jgi:hypothetical protein